MDSLFTAEYEHGKNNLSVSASINFDSLDIMLVIYKCNAYEFASEVGR